MKKEKNRPNGNKEKKSSGKAFLKKRAPIYLAIVTLLIVFVIPELTSGTLQDHIPKDLVGNEKKALEIFLSYRGPNNVGLNSIDVLAEKIKDDYPDEKIFDKKDTDVNLSISPIDGSDDVNYQILLDFNTKKENLSYEWHVNLITEELISANSNAKKILEIVDYSK